MLNRSERFDTITWILLSQSIKNFQKIPKAYQVTEVYGHTYISFYFHLKAIFNTTSISGQTNILWQDPQNQGWKPGTS